MGLTYFKRFRMEVDLNLRPRVPPPVATEYRLLAWSPSLLDLHAEAKYLSFRAEVDANVFPCLGELPGCLRLMSEITRKPGFLPQSTWLLTAVDRDRREELCGTIQGIVDPSGLGAVQNLGVVPEYRGRGLGSLLLLKALEGFRQAGLSRAFLEVTSQNEGAIRLYRRLGFARVRTVYKVVEVAYS